MKKIFSLLTAILLLSAMAFTASAAGGIVLSSAVGKAGQQVTMTVTLQEAVTADQVLIVYEYDNRLLTPEPAHNQWEAKGSISDFMEPKDKDTSAKGAWAASEAVELKNILCTLTFRIKSGASFDSTKVSCTVTVMNGGKETGKYSAQAQVLTSCSHSYGPWESRDHGSHERVCTICNDKQSGSHRWDEGKLTADPDNRNNALMVYTCSVCSGTRSIVIEDAQLPPTQPTGGNSHDTQQGGQQQGGQQNNPQPTQPQQNQQGSQQPTQPQQNSQGGQQSTQPQKPETWMPNQQGDQFQDQTQNTMPTDPFTGLPETAPSQQQPEQTNPYDTDIQPDHTHPQITVPGDIEHDHDHTPAGDAATPVVIVAAVAVLAGALVYFVKKKW